MLLAVAAMAQVQNPDYLTYISKYKKAAVDQQIAHKIPACITLAQGILESGAGRSELAVEANNHFGIKCHSDWTGDSIHRDDDKQGECFRKYDDPAQSYEDHSRFLGRARYKSLFDLDIRDYKGWARGLKTCGYATDPNYATKLIKIIEDYNLVAVTDAVLIAAENEQNEAEKAETEKGAAVEKEKNSTSQTTTQEEKATTDKKKSRERDSRKHREKNVVDEAFAKPQQAPQQETLTEEVVEPRKKRTNAKVGVVDLYIGHEVRRHAGKKYIIAEAGDTYRGIAAEFNIELKRLLRYNNASEHEKPRAGERIFLNSKRPARKR